MRSTWMSAKPAAAKARASMSCVPSWKNIGQTSDATRASVIGKISAQPQARRAPQTATAARPPGRSTRRISPRARTGSGTYISPRPHRAASKQPSQNGSSSASARSNRTWSRPRAAAARAAASIISPAMSVPTTAPAAPTVSRHSECDQPGSARDVEHALTRPQASHLEHQLMGRRELGLPGGLVGRRRPIPAIALDTPLQARIHGGQTSWPLRRTARRSGVAWAKTSR